MIETKFQRHLVEAAEALGGYAKKLSHRTLVGVPDLLVKLPAYPACLIECKRVSRKRQRLKTEGEYVQFTPAVTALQDQHLLSFKRAGGISGLVVLIEGSWPQLIFAEPYSEIYRGGTVRCPVSKLIWRRRGEEWPIETIIEAIARDAGTMTVSTRLTA